jgi:hypothetical protein
MNSTTKMLENISKWIENFPDTYPTEDRDMSSEDWRHYYETGNI